MKSDTPPPNHEQQAAAWSAVLTGAPAERLLAWAADWFAGTIAFASSLGAEDQVLTHLIALHAPNVPAFSLDTGRLFPETYDLLRATERRYGLRIQVYFPQAAAVEALVNEHGIDAYRESIELRKECCRVRKVEPLRRALAGRAAWICGLRRDQAVTRREMAPVEWDAANGLYKINPLADWSEAQVWEFIRAHQVSYHTLHDRGFPSLGCACCTRAIAPGEDVRAGRWWWENPEHKECGLHHRLRNAE